MQFITKLLASWRALSPRTHIIIVEVALTLFLGFLLFFFFGRSERTQTQLETFETPSLPVSIENTYEDGVHTLEGTVTLRNRCQRLSTIASLDESSSPATIRVDLTSEHDEEICLEIPDTRTFSLEVEGPENAAVQIFINGIPQSGNAL